MPEQSAWQHRFHIYAKENWYRDVWMVILSVIVVFSIIQAQNVAQKANDSAQQSQIAVKDIQQERSNSILRACNDQNTRHDNTIKALKAAIMEFEKHPSPGFSKSQIRRNIQQNINLINAIAPHQDCKVVVSASTHSGG